MLLVKTPQPSALERSINWAQAVFLLGLAAVLLPTMFDVARLTWTTEQGGHAPIIVATGAWLLWRELKATSARPRPGNLLLGSAAFAATIVGYVVARITGIIELEGFAMYAVIISAFYLLVGGALLRALWFPILYLAVALPPPDTLVTAITQPLKGEVTWALAMVAPSSDTISFQPWAAVSAAVRRPSDAGLPTVCAWLRERAMKLPSRSIRPASQPNKARVSSRAPPPPSPLGAAATAAGHHRETRLVGPPSEVDSIAEHRQLDCHRWRLQNRTIENA